VFYGDEFFKVFKSFNFYGSLFNSFSLWRMPLANTKDESEKCE
jgi:hypothetical protein